MDNFQYLWENSSIIESSGGFFTPPDGEHTVKLSNAIQEFYEKSNLEKFPCVTLELTIIDGQYAGRSFRKKSILSTKENIGYFKSDLKLILGNVPNEFVYVVPLLQNMGIGKVLKVNVKTIKSPNGKEYKNIYINEVLDKKDVFPAPAQQPLAPASDVPQKMNFNSFVPEEVPF